MAQKLEVPKFANESEEARWWFENQDLVADELELAGLCVVPMRQRQPSRSILRTSNERESSRRSGDWSYRRMSGWWCIGRC